MLPTLHVGAVLPALALVLVGCGRDPVREVPYHLEPGSVQHVHQQLHGSKSDSGIERMGVMPVRQSSQPNIPVATLPEHAFLWFSKTLSDDKESMRWDHWATIRVRDAGFVEEQWMSDAIYLNSLDDYVIDGDGNITGRPMGAGAFAPPQPASGTGSSGAAWIPAPTGDQRRVTVLEVQGNNPPRQVYQGTAPAAQGTSTQRYEDLIRQFTEAGRAADAGQAPPAATPGATPVPNR